MADEENLRSDFDQFDTDKNGSIDEAEFGSLLEFLGLDFSPQQTSLAFRAIDGDGSGVIEFDEFSEWWLKYQNS